MPVFVIILSSIQMNAVSSKLLALGGQPKSPPPKMMKGFGMNDGAVGCLFRGTGWGMFA